MAILKELKIAKKYLKKDHVSFFKAFPIHGDEELVVDRDYEVMGLDQAGAIQILMNQMSTDEVDALIGQQVAFVVFDVDRFALNTTDLVDPELGEEFFNQNQLAITLKNKLYKMHVEDRIIDDLKYDYNPQNEIKTLIELALRSLS